MAKAPGTPDVAALQDAVENLRRDVASLREQVRELRLLQEPDAWRELLLAHYVSRVSQIGSVAGVAAWADGDGLTVVTVVEGYDEDAEYRVIDCQIEAYNERLNHLPIDFQVHAPGPQLAEELRGLEDDLLWRRG